MANFLKQTPLAGFFYDPTRDERKAEEGLIEGREAYRGLQVPELAPVQYEGPQYAGPVTAAEAEAALVGPSAYGDIAVDPRLKAAQMQQLAALEQLRAGGGLTDADRANLARISNEEAMKEQAQRGAIMQGAQARGTGGSNLALMQMLMAQQAGANRQSQRDLDIAGMAQERGLRAGESAANLAGRMGAQDFSQQAQVAAARDAAAKFNAQMTGQTSQFNVGNQLRADLANQGTQQGVFDKIAQMKMEQERQNKIASPTAQYGMASNKAGGIQRAGESQADYYAKKADTAAKQQSGLWGGANALGMEALKHVPWSSMFGGTQSGGTPANNYVEADRGAESYTAPEYKPEPTNYVERREEEEPWKPYKGY